MCTITHETRMNTSGNLLSLYSRYLIRKYNGMHVSVVVLSVLREKGLSVRVPNSGVDGLGVIMQAHLRLKVHAELHKNVKTNGQFSRSE